MNCHLAQWRVSFAATCALLLALLVTTDAYRESSRQGPTQGSSANEVALRGSASWQNYDGPIELGQSPGSVVATHANDNGLFTTGLTSPASTSTEKIQISAIIRNNGSVDAGFTMATLPTSQQSQISLALTPTEGPPGTIITAEGGGFTPNQPVTVIQSGGIVFTGGSATIRADQSGSITMSFRVANQTPPGVITVSFTQGDNTATAQFRVRRPSSGIGGVPSQPIKGTIDQFTQWLNACVNGRLNIPMCTTGG
jgi:hypothetical protein